MFARGDMRELEWYEFSRVSRGRSMQTSEENPLTLSPVTLLLCIAEFLPIRVERLSLTGSIFPLVLDIPPGQQKYGCFVHPVKRIPGFPRWKC